MDYIVYCLNRPFPRQCSGCNAYTRDVSPNCFQSQLPRLWRQQIFYFYCREYVREFFGEFASEHVNYGKFLFLVTTSGSPFMPASFPAAAIASSRVPSSSTSLTSIACLPVNILPSAKVFLPHQMESFCRQRQP